MEFYLYMRLLLPCMYRHYTNNSVNTVRFLTGIYPGVIAFLDAQIEGLCLFGALLLSYHHGEIHQGIRYFFSLQG